MYVPYEFRSRYPTRAIVVFRHSTRIHRCRKIPPLRSPVLQSQKNLSDLALFERSPA